MNNNFAFMPRPVPVPELEQKYLLQTLRKVKEANKSNLSELERTLTSEFISLVPIALVHKHVNRSMLAKMLDFEEKVITPSNSMKILDVNEQSSKWLKWALARRHGVANDGIDIESLAVQQATNKLPDLLQENTNTQRLGYTQNLPHSLLAWCVYSQTKGYCLYATVFDDSKSDSKKGGLFPVKTILSSKWSLVNGMISIDRNELLNVSSDMYEFDEFHDIYDYCSA